jgi:hypothetical protein
MTTIDNGSIRERLSAAAMVAATTVLAGLSLINLIHRLFAPLNLALAAVAR